MAEPRFPPISYYAKVTLTIVAVLFGVAAAWTVRNILTLVVVAAVLAVGLDPAVRRLERLHLSRGWAVTVIFVATVGFIVLFALLVIPPLFSEVRKLAADIPGYVARLRANSDSFRDLDDKYHIGDKLKDVASRLPALASTSFGTILRITGSVASVIFNLLTIMILTIYFLMALPRGHRTAIALFRRDHRQRDAQVLEEALERVGGYVSGNIIISVIAGGASFVAFRMIGVPFAGALSLWVAIADLIPSVGATLGAIAAVAVAAFSSTGDAIATGIFFLVYQQVENYVISPRVMKEAVDLSPAAVIVSVLIGGSLAGFAGALLALPLAAAAKVVVKDLWLGERLASASEIELPAGVE